MLEEMKNNELISDKVVPETNSNFNWFRPLIQWFFVLFSISLGLQFRAFVLNLENQNWQSASLRPPAVEGYLPISSLMSLTYYAKAGIANRVHPAGLVIFTLTLILAILVRRGFCSWVCPIGTASEYAHKTGKFIFGKNLVMPKFLDIILRLIKFSLLGFFLYYILRMPAAALGNFINSPYNRIADIKMYLFFRNISFLAAVVIVVIGILSLFFKNFLCRYLCPYGALLGIFSVLSPVSVRRNLDKCTACGKCRQACPNQIPVDVKKTVRSMECTACFDCIVSCKVKEAIAVKPTGGKPAISILAYGILTIAVFFFTAQIARIFGYWQSETSVQSYSNLYEDIVEISHP